VDGAIHRAAGPALLEACQAVRARQGGCPAGQAVITSAGRLPARFVIHAVGPCWQDGLHGEPELLAATYRSCFELIRQHGITSIAFPNISTGIYRFPKDHAAEIAWHTTQETLPFLPTLKQIAFVCFEQDNYDLYQQLITTGHISHP